MENTAILNYPGSKRRLLDFIYESSKDLINPQKIVLDIFSGTGCVAQLYKSKGFQVATNDTEIYSCHIANAILNGFNRNSFDVNSFNGLFRKNQEELIKLYSSMIKTEETYIETSSLELIPFDENIPKIFNIPDGFTINDIPIKDVNDLNNNLERIPFCLFSLYYSGSYFGLKQSITIDSIRYAIENSPEHVRSVLLTCLIYAMKEATFSKDGHMAQPLNHEKNFKKLISCRSKDILQLFFKELEQFDFETPESSYSQNRNQSFLDLIEDDAFLDTVGFIYADPPYTDMQYSRYFHLLTTVCNYIYPQLTVKHGNLTTGLYADNRFQSSISNRSKALEDLRKLMNKAAAHNITLMFSYAYPVDRDNQPTDRYTMCIDDLISAMGEFFSDVKILKENFQHCNNRNNSAKKVYEYLIIGIPNNNN